MSPYARRTAPSNSRTLEATRTDLYQSLREALDIPWREKFNDYGIVKKHKTTGKLGPDVALSAVTTKFVQRVEKEMPGIFGGSLE